MSNPKTKNQRHIVAAIEAEYRRYKSLGEGTFSQLEARDFLVKPTPESLSIAMVVWHVSGNLESRFTDFLTTDGEKPWRDRESEFAERQVDRREMLAKWERGWTVLFDALAALTDANLTRTVSIRGISATVGEALARSLAHTSYHVGQITFLGKMLRRSEWKYLSIPPGMSAAYNASPTMEKGRPPAGARTAKASAKKSARNVSVKRPTPVSVKGRAGTSVKTAVKAPGKSSSPRKSEKSGAKSSKKKGRR